MKKRGKLVNTLLSLCLATMMVPATAFAEAGEAAAGTTDVPENLRLSDMRFADATGLRGRMRIPLKVGSTPPKPMLILLSTKPTANLPCMLRWQRAWRARLPQNTPT